MKQIIAVALVILSVAMFYLSLKAGALPPGVTGIGFILIAIVFFNDSRK